MSYECVFLARILLLQVNYLTNQQFLTNQPFFLFKAHGGYHAIARSGLNGLATIHIKSQGWRWAVTWPTQAAGGAMFYSMGVGGRARARLWFQICIFYVHPENWGRCCPISTHIFQIG